MTVKAQSPPTKAKLPAAAAVRPSRDNSTVVLIRNPKFSYRKRPDHSKKNERHSALSVRVCISTDPQAPPRSRRQARSFQGREGQVCISPVMSNFEQTASIAGLMFPGETCMRPYGPCPLISLRIPRPRGLLALILINWVLWAAQPIVMLCRWRYPRVTSWIVDALLRLSDPR
jgi:hypothetical protein